jgi:hypothetical protein
MHFASLEAHAGFATMQDAAAEGGLQHVCSAERGGGCLGWLCAGGIHI